MGLSKLFGKSSDQNEENVRIDLSDRYYTLLMQTLESYDVARYNMKPYVDSRLNKDDNGYFLRLPFNEANLLYGAIQLLWKDLSNKATDRIKEISRNEKLPEGERQKALDEMLNIILTSRKETGDIEELLQVFDYQLCPEQYHPFGAR